MENKDKFKDKTSSEEGRATHSGWNFFYIAWSRYRQDAISLGRNLMNPNLSQAVNSLQAYHSTLYSMAQQVFSFYDSKTEDQLTAEWLSIGDEVSDFVSLYNDPSFRKQMEYEGRNLIDKELRVKLLKFFNKIDRLATLANLNVGKEEAGSTEPKKGLLGSSLK